MLTLTLFRHAKSCWDDPKLEDFDRPLAPRGEKAAPKMAAFLAERDLVPDHILCSDACRTRQTVALALPYWKPEPGIDYAKALYMASVETLITMVRDAPPRAEKLMVVGHNPGLESFATHLIGSGDKAMRSALAHKFPTAAAAVIRFDLSGWSKIARGKGRLELFVTPKTLR